MKRKNWKFLLLLLVLTFGLGQNGGCLGFLSSCIRDTTPPSIQITNPSNNSTVSGIVTIRATATDNIGVAKVEFYVDGSKVGEDTSRPYEYNWNTDTLTYGTQHSIQAKAYDNAGNVGESPIITVTIGDSNAPEVVITNPTDGSTVSGTVLIQAQVTERSKKTKAPSGVAKVEFYIDNNKVGEDTSSPYEYSWNTTTVSNSNHILVAKAIDNAGNSADSMPITVSVNNIYAIYAGGSYPGKVYTYNGTQWTSISPELGDAVLSIVLYNGHLFAGVTTSDGRGQVWRYEGGNNWILVGDNLDDKVCSLAVYQGELYAGTAWNGMRLYRYISGSNWEKVVDYYPWNGTSCLYVYNNYLLMGDLGYDLIGIWDGTSFYPVESGWTGSCIYDFQEFNGKVYASAWYGRLWESSDGTSWNILLDYGSSHMWELEVFNNALYMGYENGELRASSVPDYGTLIYTAPDGIISMTKSGNNLYFGTGADALYYYGGDGIANIYRYDGSSVTQISENDEFGGGVQVLYAP